MTIKINPISFWVIIYVVKILYSCSENPLLQSESEYRINDSYIKDNLDLQIITELEEYLNDFDSIQIVNLESLEDPIQFLNSHELIFLISNSELILSSNSISSIQGYTASNVSNRFMDYSLDFLIYQKLESEDDDQDYIIKSIHSGLRGNTSGKSWEQFEYNYQLQFGTAIIDISGYITYAVIIDDYGLILKDYRHYKIILDIHTGQPINFYLL